jgi:PelA/Pel-15E family pectate lyase
MKPLIAFLLLALPPGSSGAVRWTDVLNQSSSWHSSDEARRVAENVLLYQHPNGGWAKNIDMARELALAEIERVEKERGKNEATIDNGATWTQLRFLARMHLATAERRYAEAFLRGFDYLLAAQYDNGGWPMIHPPPPKGYYKEITFNDGAMIGVMRLLRDAALGGDSFGFIDPERRKRARRAVEKGTDLILKSQVVIDGRRTVWCAQHDRETLAPCAARTYELPSLSGSESAGIAKFLMEIEAPTPGVVQAIEAAIAWFERSKIQGIRVEVRNDSSLPRGLDRVVVADSSAPPLWARFYDLKTNRPLFAGRDGVPKGSLAEIEHERRIGYSWLGPYGDSLLEQDYPAWSRKNLQR